MTGPYKIGTLARLTGFSVAVLRAWERRFGLLVPERGSGGHRLYSDDDLQILRHVRTLIDEGRSIGEIARPGRDALLVQATLDQGMGQSSFLPSASGIDEWQRRLIAAALALDARGVSATIDESFAALSPEDAIQQIIEPVAVEVGRLWETGACSIASEHLISEEFLHRIRRLLDAAQPADVGAPTVVAACFPGEQHQLGLAILAWRIARRGVRVAYLGPALPLADLVAALPRSRCRAALLSVTRRSVFKAHYPAIFRSLSRGPRVFIGGQGVPARFEGDPADGGIACLRDLSDEDTVDRILAVVRDSRQARAVAAGPV